VISRSSIKLLDCTTALDAKLLSLFFVPSVFVATFAMGAAFAMFRSIRFLLVVPWPSVQHVRFWRLLNFAHNAMIATQLTEGKRKEQ
jgi:hypothetical protein